MRRLLSLLLLALVAGCRAVPPVLYSGAPPPSPTDTSALAGMRVVLDPGHGGEFSGAVGPGGTLEKDVNLDVALALRDLLSAAGADVFLTREGDTRCGGEEGDPLAADLVSRRRMSWDYNPLLFISIHHNGGPRGVNRVETYYKLGNEGASLDLARAIHRRLLECTGIEENFIRAGNYRIMRDNPAICVLLEAAYLTDPGVESALADPEARKREAYYIFLGIVDYVSRGIPVAEYLEPFVVGPVSTIAVKVGGDIDPDTIDVKLDDGYPDYSYSSSSGIVRCHSPTPLRSGVHTLSVFARNAGGNALWRGVSHFKVESQPGAAICCAGRPVPLDREVSFGAYLLDSFGNPVSAEMDISVRGGRLTRGYDFVGRRFYAVAESADFEVTLAWEGGEEVFTFHAVPDTDQRSLFVVDASTGEGIPRCIVEAGGEYRGETNEDGHAIVRAETGEELTLRADGYEERALDIQKEGGAPSQIVTLSPRHDGMLLGVKFFIDPEGTFTGAPLAEIDDFWANLRTAQVLRGLLLRAGGRCFLSLRPMSDSEKLKAVEEYGPSIYVSVGRAGSHSLRFCPGSGEGKKLAEAVSAHLASRPPVEESADYLLVQTSMVAVRAMFPPAGPADEEASALFEGILEHLKESKEEHGRE